MKFLDLSGLQYFFDKIKNRLKSYYGTCTTSASTQEKVVECEGFKLETGAKITVKFTNAQTYNGTATLNVNGTGAKNICRVGTTTTTRYYWSAGEVVDFVYDGTNYVMEGKGVATTTYYGVTKLSNSVSSTSTSLAGTANAVKTAYDLANTANTQATANATDIGIINTNLGNKQDTLVSGTNIKTINGTSILGSGDITIESGGSGEGLTIYNMSEIFPNFFGTTDFTTEGEYIYEFTETDTAYMQKLAEMSNNPICGLRCYNDIDGMDRWFTAMKTEAVTSENMMYFDYNGNTISLEEAMTYMETDPSNLFGCIGGDINSFHATDFKFINGEYEPFTLCMQIIPLVPAEYGFDISYMTKVKVIVSIENNSNGGSTGLPTLGETFRIWDLEAGVYVTSTNSWKCYYWGATNTSYVINGGGKSALVVVYEQINAANEVYKMFVIFGGPSGVRYCYNGYSTETSGQSKNFDLSKSYLTSISSYVKNNLTYTSSNTTYALSAYQGYLLDQRLKALEACPYDVGDLYITANNTDPNIKWSGTTWVQIKDTFLLACGDKYGAGTTGGEEEVTLKVEEIPSHSHGQNVTANENSGGSGIRQDYVRDAGGLSIYPQGVSTEQVGGGQAHNNIPPYLAVYVWKRTS